MEALIGLSPTPDRVKVLSKSKLIPSQMQINNQAVKGILAPVSNIHNKIQIKGKLQPVHGSESACLGSIRPKSDLKTSVVASKFTCTEVVDCLRPAEEGQKRSGLKCKIIDLKCNQSAE